MSEEHWWAFGDYTGDDCPNCSRTRLLKVTDPSGKDRVICEKCHWEPAIKGYAPDVDSD